MAWIGKARLEGDVPDGCVVQVACCQAVCGILQATFDKLGAEGSSVVREEPVQVPF